MRSCFDADCGRAYLLFLWLIAAIDSPVLAVVVGVRVNKLLRDSAATLGRARLLGLLLLLIHGPARGLGLVG
jgi:hypothetical protein